MSNRNTHTIVFRDNHDRLELDPARITRVEDVYDLTDVRYTRVHFKCLSNCLEVPPLTILDDDGDLYDELIKAGVSDPKQPGDHHEELENSGRLLAVQ